MKDHLAAIISGLQIEAARWVPRENLHVTLRFLGPVEDARIAAVSDAIGAAAAGLVDVPVRLDELGAFPSVKRARVLWAGLDDPAGGLVALHAAVADALVPVGFERETRAYTPHITLARIPRPHPVSLGARLAPLRFTVDRATLYESRISKDGAHYSALAVFPFHRPLAPPRDD